MSGLHRFFGEEPDTQRLVVCPLCLDVKASGDPCPECLDVGKVTSLRAAEIRSRMRAEAIEADPRREPTPDVACPRCEATRYQSVKQLDNMVRVKRCEACGGEGTVSHEKAAEIRARMREQDPRRDPD